MNITLVGYGRMGREVEAIARERGHSIHARVDPETGDHRVFSSRAIADADGIIEFALPEGILDRISLAGEYGIPYVIGTTGWDDQKEKLDLVKTQDSSLLLGSNFSIGANLFFRIAEQAAGLINAFSDYDIMMFEYHHKKKRDSPSGTALSIADKILRANRRKTEICSSPLQREIRDSELHIGSLRGGSIPGIHRVILDSPADSIVLEHSARNRSGFASGAVLGLEWLKGRRGCYSVDEFFTDLIADSRKDPPE